MPPGQVPPIVGHLCVTRPPETLLDVLPIDLTAIVAIVMGMLVVLIPIAGLTARFALKPLVESFAKLFDIRDVEGSLQMSERRMALMEQQVEILEDEVRRLREAKDFDAALQAGQAKAQISGAPPSSGTERSGG